MGKIVKSLLSVSAIILFFVIALASNPSKKVFKNSSEWIPDDFNPNTTILLVQKFSISNKEEQKMENYMAEKYPYKYEFADLNTIKMHTGKYSNVKIYKYALVFSSHDTHTTKEQGASTNAGLTVTGFDFNFYDREFDKNYPATRKPSSYPSMTFKPVINTILKHFE